MHDLHKLIAGREFKSVEELNQFLEKARKSGDFKRVRELPRDEKEIARDLAYQAMEADDFREIESLARRALEHDPECVDALRLLALGTSRSREERISKLEDVVRTGARLLGDGFFEKNRGHFWGILETRPYMRARYDLAYELLREGKEEEGVAHLEAILDLNRNDNQGVRYELLPRYLEAGALEKARKLLEAYPNDYSAVFHWCRVLERHLSGDLEGAAAALKEAREMNRFVEAYLSGGKLPPRTGPAQYSPGGSSEAAAYAKDLRRAWLAHREAAAWLKEQRGKR